MKSALFVDAVKRFTTWVINGRSNKFWSTIFSEIRKVGSAITIGGTTLIFFHDKWPGLSLWYGVEALIIGVLVIVIGSRPIDDD